MMYIRIVIHLNIVQEQKTFFWNLYQLIVRRKSESFKTGWQSCLYKICGRTKADENCECLISLVRRFSFKSEKASKPKVFGSCSLMC